jgi:hypothetical protein
MGFYLFKGKTSVEESGTISTDEINVDDVDYKKKQNPNFSVANNDYFFQNPTTIKFLFNFIEYIEIAKSESNRQFHRS